MSDQSSFDSSCTSTPSPPRGSMTTTTRKAHPHFAASNHHHHPHHPAPKIAAEVALEHLGPKPSSASQAAVWSMRITQLNICAQLENVTDLMLQDESVPFYVKVQCDKCLAVSDKPVPISASHRVPIMNGRSYVNCVYRCKYCERNGHIILLDRLGDGSYTLNDSNEYRTFAEFECRGARPVSCTPEASAFRCRSTRSKLVFQNIELTNDDRSWADYDEFARVAVGIYDVHCRLVNVASIKK